jgi:trans-aconitate methyltransferase
MTWLPALGMPERLAAGTTVADGGGGRGTSTIVMAQMFPASSFAGFDADAGSVAAASDAADDAGVADEVVFDVATATTFAGAGYGLVCTFDALHHAHDRDAVVRHVRDALAADGSWLVVERVAACSDGGSELAWLAERAGFAHVRRVANVSTHWVFEVRRSAVHA